MSNAGDLSASIVHGTFVYACIHFIDILHVESVQTVGACKESVLVRAAKDRDVVEVPLVAGRSGRGVDPASEVGSSTHHQQLVLEGFEKLRCRHRFHLVPT